ncbi:MAG: hypothetical protein JWP34_5161 [Massilia sp.]|nr:hypothetical protein [Massilia sp.]
MIGGCALSTRRLHFHFVTTRALLPMFARRFHLLCGCRPDPCQAKRVEPAHSSLVDEPSTMQSGRTPVDSAENAALGRIRDLRHS